LERLSITGGVVYPRKGTRLSKGGFSWPFAKLVLHGEGIELAPRGVLRRLAPHVAIPYNELSRVELRVAPLIGRIGGTLVFRLPNEDFDRISFSAPRSGIALAVRRLREIGVRVI